MPSVPTVAVTVRGEERPTGKEESVVAMYESSMVEGGMTPVTSAPDTHAAAGHGHAVLTPATTHVTAPSTAHVSSTPTTTHMATTTMTPTTMPGDSK